ncbi:MAG: hypothetical protein ACTSUK_03860 [Promethearchaeota archaeon]
MAATDLSYYANDPYIGGPYAVRWFQAGDGNMKAGYVCMDDDEDEVKICATNGVPFGVIGRSPAVDLDTAISSGEPVKVYIIGVGTMMWLKHDGTNQTVTKGGHLARSDGTAGAVENFSYTDGAVATDTLQVVVGKGIERVATSSTAIWIQAILAK